MTTENEKYQPLVENAPLHKISTGILPKLYESMRYDPLQVPPDFRIAEGHHVATRISEAIPSERPEIDQQSGLPLNNRQLSMFDSTYKLSPIAPAYPMFFQFKKFCLIIGFTILLASGVHNMFTNYKGTVCRGLGLEKHEQPIETYHPSYQPPSVTYTQPSSYNSYTPSEPSTDYSYSSQPEDQIYEFLAAKSGSKSGGKSKEKAAAKPSAVKSGVKRIKDEFAIKKNTTEGHMDKCQKNAVNLMSVANILDDPVALDIGDIYNFFTICLIGLLMQILRKIQKQTAQVADERAITASDYSIRVSNLPRSFGDNVDIDEEIRTFFVNNGVHGKTMNVQNVSVCYDVRDKVKIQSKIKEVGTNRSKLLARKKNGELVGDDDIRKLENEIEALRNSKEAISQRFQEGKGVSKYFTGEAYVTFETQQELQDVLRNWRFSTRAKVAETLDKRSVYKLRGNLLNVSQAPEPSDVFWENAGTSQSAKFTQRLITNCVTAVLLAIAFYTIFSIEKKKFVLLDGLSQKASREEKHFVVTVQVQLVTVVASIFVAIVNLILKSVMYYFTEREKFNTYTEFQAAYAMRLALAQFFNISVVTFFVYVYFDNIVGPGGLIYTAFCIFISDAIITWAFTLLNPAYLIYWIRRYRLEKNRGEANVMTQEELNGLYTLPPFDFSYKYAALAKTLLSASFFAALVPPVTIVALVNIGVDYWLDKYVIFRRTSRGKGTGPELSFDFIEFLEYCLVFFAIGNFILNIYILGQAPTDEILTLLGMFIGIVNAFAPMGEINEKLFPARDEITTNDKYSDLRYTFTEDYDRSNPATEDIASAHYLSQREKHLFTGAL